MVERGKYHGQRLKAKEVLRLYTAGERDFRGTILRGCNFRGANLSGADFTRARIEGTIFSQANLRNSIFDKAISGTTKAGLTLRVLLLLALTVISGYTSGYTGIISAYLIDQDIVRRFSSLPGILVLTALTFTLLYIYKRGLKIDILWFSLIILVPILIFVNSLLAASIASIASFISGTFVCFIVFLCSFIIGRYYAFLAASITSMLIALVLSYIKTIDGYGNSLLACFISLVPIAFAIYLGWSEEVSRNTRNNFRSATKDICLLILSFYGTRLKYSDLSFSSFQDALLKDADFSNSCMNSVCLRGAELVHSSRFKNTILEDLRVLKLLISGDGFNQDFSDCNFREANLEDANLANSSFDRSILSNAKLKSANLQGASLVEAQCIGADFNLANLTGACIESWNIDESTLLEGSNCQYIYLLRNQKERRPNSGNFQPGEFTKLFQEVLDTIDLIFQNGIDWKVFARTFGQVQVQYEDAELSVQSIENKGDGVVVVKLNAAPGINKAAVHQTFMEGYQVALKEAEARYKAQLAAKDEQITDYRQQNANMQEVVKLLASRPVTVDVKPTLEKKIVQGDDYSRSISVGGNLNASGSTINLGEISGQVSNQINQLPDAAPDQPNLKDLLTQLQAAVEADTELSEVEKKEALGEVAKLAEAGSQPKEGTMQRMAKRATAALKSITEPLSDASKLATACKTLLPLILSVF
jgi:uncharacterized protein YjbI with pentapeptide repeats